MRTRNTYHGVSAIEYGHFHYEDGGSLADLEYFMLTTMSGTDNVVPQVDVEAARQGYQDAQSADSEVV